MTLDAIIVFDDGHGNEGHDLVRGGKIVERYRQKRGLPETGVTTRPPAPTPQARPVARPRERHAHRTTRASRAGPDDDPGEPEPPRSDALSFAVALQSHLRSFAAVLESEHRQLHGITETSYDVLNREVVALRSTVAVYIEAEKVARAVGL